MPKISKAKKHAMIAAKKQRIQDFFKKQLGISREKEILEIEKEFQEKAYDSRKHWAWRGKCTAPLETKHSKSRKPAI
ncbi:MAG: hypothetical protein ABFD50_05205 [Smithella sp.]